MSNVVRLSPAVLMVCVGCRDLYWGYTCCKIKPCSTHGLCELSRFLL